MSSTASKKIDNSKRIMEAGVADPASFLEYPDSPTKESVRWTPEEDEMLRAAVALYKGKNWKKIFVK